MQTHESNTSRSSVGPFIAHLSLALKAVFRKNIFQASGKTRKGVNSGSLRFGIPFRRLLFCFVYQIFNGGKGFRRVNARLGVRRGAFGGEKARTTWVLPLGTVSGTAMSRRSRLSAGMSTVCSIIIIQ
jgi:hypothetical protein